jgi:tetratricopeptide (TPR) repeat protein
VCAGDGVAADAVLDLLTHLVDKSLVVVEIKPDDARRYRLLEPVRQYAHEKLRESGEAERMNGRHVAFFLQLVEAAEPQLHAPEQIVWLDRLEAERANLYAALQWLLNPQRGDPEHEAGVRLAGALLWFWWERGDFSAGRRWLEACLAYCNSALQRTSAQAKVLKGAGCLAGLQGDYALARACLQESARIWQELGDAAGVADVRTWLTIMALEQGDYATARPMAEESVALARSTGDSWLHAHALFALGWAFRGQGDYVLARAHYEQSVRLFRSVGDKWGLGLAVLNLGIMAYEQADYAAAQPLFEERLAIGRAFGSKHFIAGALERLGYLALHTHDYGRAVALLEESLALY